MKQRVWQGVGVVLLFLCAGPSAWAGVQAKDQVYWVGTGSWQLREVDGEVCLVQCRWRRFSRLPRSERFPWYISTPTIKDAKDRYLAGDPAGRTASVQLVDKKGTSTRWVFVIGSHLRPRPAENEGRGNHFEAGPSGFTFQAKLAEGPLAGWYLASGEPVTKKDRQGKEVRVRPMKLVKDVREATTFTYIDTNYYVDHK